MNDELDILISRYLDGTASAEEVEQLERQLAADPRVAEALYQASYYDVLLRDTFVTAEGSAADIACPIRLPVAEVSPAIPSVSERRGTSANSASYRLPAHWATWRRVAAIAACLVIGLLVAWRVMRPGANSSRDVIAQTPVSPERSAARIVSSGDGTVIDNPWGARGVAGNGDHVSSDEQVRTGPYASAMLTFDGESTRIRLAPQTTMMLASGGSKRLDLIAGRVDCEVARQSPNRPLVVLTPQAQVTVVGTKFDVSVNRDWTRIHVTEGTVRVMRRTDGATVEVSAGEFVDVPGGDARPATWAAPPAGRDMAEYWSVKVRPAGIKE